MKNVLQQIFDGFFQAKGIQEFEKSCYLIECGANKQISLDCTDQKEITEFIECFFYTNVDRVNMTISGNTLKFPCKMRYVDKIKKAQGSTSIDIKELTITCECAAGLYSDYYIKT